MAERRMMTKKVTDDDNFMSLSSSAQALYLHLSMNADDDGFCNQVSASMFKAHASVQDLQALLEKRYIYQFENGVIVIKHWRMANALRKDRYTPTSFQEELAQLQLKNNGAYTFLGEEDTLGCHLVAERLPQNRIDKNNNNTQKNAVFSLVYSFSDDETVTNLLLDWLDVRKAKRSAQTEKAIKQNLDRLNKYAQESNLSITEYLEEVIRRGWAAFYPIPTFGKTKEQPKSEVTPSYDLEAYAESQMNTPIVYRGKKK